MSDIVLVGQKEKGYTLQSGSDWTAKLYNGKKEGEVEVKDEHQCVSAVLHYQNDKLNGICKFYDEGTLKEECTYVNDVKEGWAWEYKNWEKVGWYIYADGKKKSTLKKFDTVKGHWEEGRKTNKVTSMLQYNIMKDYWVEEDIETEQVSSICKYDENNLRDGKGYLFDNGQINRIIWFDHGKQKDVMKIFEQDKMTEYEDTGFIVYEGGFKDDLLDYYPREGQGMEFVGDRQLVYKGEWRNNKRNGYGKSVKNGYAEYEGEWEDGLPNGSGALMKDGKLYKGDWNRGIFKVNDVEFYDYKEGCLRRRVVQMVIENENQLRELLSDKEKKFCMSELVIDGGCGNEMKDDLELCGFENLESLVIRCRSLQNLNSLKISNNPVLKSIEVRGGNGGSNDASKNTSPFHYVKSVVISGSLFD